MKRNGWYIVFALLLLTGCGAEENNEQEVLAQDEEIDSVMSEEVVIPEEVEVEVPKLVAKRDSVALSELGYSDNLLPDFLSYLQSPPEDPYDRWLESYWGRCCTEADMQLNELLFYTISTSQENERYPFSNALDDNLENAYAFLPEEEVAITVTVNTEGRIQYENSPLIRDLIQAGDTLVNPFRIGILNGYVKSPGVFQGNARIKEVQIYLNDVHQCNVLLEDDGTPQVIQGNFPFTRDDTVRIVPVDYYNGSEFEDVCISALQRNLGVIGVQKLNGRYSIYER